MTRQPGLTSYGDRRHYPELVWRAVELTRERGYPLACTPESRG